MDIHKRYADYPTIDLSVLELLETAFKDDPFLLLHRLVRYYDTEITKNNLDRKKLETFRMLLCYEYQLLFTNEKKHVRTVPKQMCLKSIEILLLSKTQLPKFTEEPILYDIILLHMVLYCDSQCIKQHLINFQNSVGNCFLSNNETQGFQMRIMECFLELLQLRQYLYNNTESQLCKHLKSLYFKDITLWLEMKEEKEWRLFASIFPKLVITFGFEDVVPTVWDIAFNKLEDLKDIFAALTIIVDTSFPLNQEGLTLTHYSLCYTQRLWILIIEGLKSSIQQYRKQALFIMKRVTDFIGKLDTNNVKLKKPTEIPFVCNQTINTELSVNAIKEKFFLILEALEEKQCHLVTPALTHVSTLVKGNKEHVSCNDCFNIVWVRLIFERILKHENNAIVKQGILYAYSLDTVMYDDTFLELFVNVLNNSFLYEWKNYEEKPKILNDVADLFIRIGREKAGFVSRLLTIMNKVAWGPIPIFYMMKTLTMVSQQIPDNNLCEDNELSIVKSLVQKNLNMHSYILRIVSQIVLLKAITKCMDKINDLTLITNVLFEFSPKNAFRRGTYAWYIVICWLQNLSKKTDSVDIVQLIGKEYLLQNTFSKISPKKFACTIFMLYEAKLILHHKTCPMQQVLNNLLSSLNGVHSRPYADITLCLDTTEFISYLLELNAKNITKKITQLILPYIDVAFKFLLKTMKSVGVKLDYKDVNRYLNIIASFLYNGDLCLPTKEIFNYTEKFRNESISLLGNVDECQELQYLCGLHILHLCQDILTITPQSYYIQPLLNMYDIRIFNDNRQDKRNTRGKTASDCYILLAKLAYQYITNVPADLWPKTIDWHQNMLHLYEMGGNEIIPAVASMLRAIVDKETIKSTNDWSTFESIFAMCWKCAFLSKKSPGFSLAIENLTGVIINNNFLVRPDAMSFVNQFVDQLLEEGDNIPKLKRVLLTKMKALNSFNLRNFKEALLSCLLHGNVPHRDKKIENQAYLYITKNYSHYYSSHISILDYNNDAAIKTLSIILLHKTITADLEYSTLFLPVVLNKLEQYKNKRYFNDSYIHKIKHRITQILLILEPTLNEAATAQLQELMCNLILLESNQHSVRLMQEWILIRIFVKDISLHCRLWEFFKEGIKTRPGCTSSIASIVYHVAQLLSGDTQNNFIQAGIKYIGRCCLGQQFNMRLYNQVIFVKLYELLEFRCYANISEYRGLYNAAIESLHAGSLTKNAMRIQDDFYLSVFHPMDYYSLESICYEFPRITDLDITEWIIYELFKDLGFEENFRHPLKLINVDRLLGTVKVSHLAKSPAADAQSLIYNAETNLDGLSDIQKKIDPSSSGTARQSISHKKTSLDDEGIIVVASLIDRLPNLGGLARTCEIFSVKQLVIPNLSHVRDKDFQSLSVSAEKWIDIAEVKPHQLKEYLLEKKNMGWCLVGAEQTANSTNLLNMKFNKKTVLVLGNEKDGIPANLIPLFDTCIEIPQAGVIRSLNVHVTGAICVWQYAKQHTLV